MNANVSIISVKFRNFKALRRFQVSLQSMNILVGANNCGKSTILSAFRALSAGLRRARVRKSEIVAGPEGDVIGYHISEDSLLMSVENVHTDYAKEDTTVEFKLSNGNLIILYFPPDGGCRLIPQVEGKPIRTPTQFNAAFPITIGVVPVLGPVEYREQVVMEDTVRREVTTHRASRHFRNYWRYYPEGFEDFAALVAKTWHGMEITAPERPNAFEKELVMFCRENRILRELYWAGFGFQVWCQLLTHVSRASADNIMIVDEPEIYLHPDVQRQLLSILRDTSADVLLATHSTEIMGEADPSEILLIDKSKQNAQRLRDIEGVQAALDSIGSVQNITLTQLARNRRVLFVEGLEDFRRIRRFARVKGMQELASGIDLTPVESGGFAAWEKMEPLAWGLEKTLGQSLKIGAVFDRDYWCDEEVENIEIRLNEHLSFGYIIRQKEIENYLIVPSVLQRAFERELLERAKRSGKDIPEAESISAILERITEPFRSIIQAQYISKRLEYYRRTSLDNSTVTRDAIDEFELKWHTLEDRMTIVPGKDVLRALRTELQDNYSVNLTDIGIIDSFKPVEIHPDMIKLLDKIEEFRIN